MTGGKVVDGRFDIIKTLKCWGQIINFSDKLSKFNRKGSLELQRVENFTLHDSCL